DVFAALAANLVFFVSRIGAPVRQAALRIVVEWRDRWIVGDLAPLQLTNDCRLALVGGEYPPRLMIDEEAGLHGVSRSRHHPEADVAVFPPFSSNQVIQATGLQELDLICFGRVLVRRERDGALQPAAPVFIARRYEGEIELSLSLLDAPLAREVPLDLRRRD